MDPSVVAHIQIEFETSTGDKGVLVQVPVPLATVRSAWEGHLGDQELPSAPLRAAFMEGDAHDDGSIRDMYWFVLIRTAGQSVLDLVYLAAFLLSLLIAPWRGIAACTRFFESKERQTLRAVQQAYTESSYEYRRMLVPMLNESSKTQQVEQAQQVADKCQADLCMSEIKARVLADIDVARTFLSQVPKESATDAEALLTKASNLHDLNAGSLEHFLLLTHDIQQTRTRYTSLSEVFSLFCCNSTYISYICYW